jgi:hypothetical protein
MPTQPAMHPRSLNRCNRVPIAMGAQWRISMGSPRQKSSLVNDPLGLLALPMTSIGSARLAGHGPQSGIDGTESSLGAAIAANTIGGAPVAMLIAVSLVAPPGPPKEAQTNSHCHFER